MYITIKILKKRKSMLKLGLHVYRQMLVSNLTVIYSVYKVGFFIHCTKTPVTKQLLQKTPVIVHFSVNTSICLDIMYNSSQTVNSITKTWTCCEIYCKHLTHTIYTSCTYILLLFLHNG